MTANLSSSPIAAPREIATDDSIWWMQNREAVEDRFIGMLMAETHRKPYNGPERRSRATVVLDPADLKLAYAQAQRLGSSYEEHVRELFHKAVQAQEL